MKRVEIIEPKSIIHIFDSDWNGVPNDEDCVWYDPNRQGYEMMKLEMDTRTDTPSYLRTEIICKP